MNIQVSSPREPTQAAEGLPRRRWTVSEIREMMTAGIILEDERFELIGGEVVPMSPKGNRHEVVKQALQQHWFPLIVGSTTALITETTLYIGEEDFLEPDFLFWPHAMPLAEVTAQSSLLIVEIADTSLDYDLGIKSATYAGIGLRELWVIDAKGLSTRIHLAPGSNGYQQSKDSAHTEPLVPTLIPGLAVTLSDLGLEPIKGE